MVRDGGQRPDAGGFVVLCKLERLRDVRFGKTERGHVLGVGSRSSSPARVARRAGAREVCVYKIRGCAIYCCNNPYIYGEPK